MFSVTVDLNARSIRVIKPEDWLRVKGSKLLSRIEPFRPSNSLLPYAANLRPIISNRLTYGRACIRGQRWVPHGRITVGGFAASPLEYLEGVLLGATDAIARDTATASAPAAALAQWAEEQADLIARSKISPGRATHSRRRCHCMRWRPAKASSGTYGDSIS